MHHHGILFDKNYSGYFGKVGMSYFHRFRNKFHCPVVKVEHLWSLVPHETREKVASSGAAPVVDVMHRKAESQQTSKPFILPQISPSVANNEKAYIQEESQSPFRPIDCLALLSFPSSPIYLVQLLSLFVTVLSILPLPIVLLQLLLL
ncbi:hypothetical protein RJ639_003770 [Escallonia herrerae]|uniref:Uncharacterized protein n=1 Tax=Escallonia herrerae TaxID=1293975 RepID=A0AA89AYV0_9ASTE|nr:hypothetical protein RJ639_003770 [Escallonia herrerae]